MKENQEFNAEKEFFNSFPDTLIRADKHFKKMKTDSQELTEGWISKHFVVEVHRSLQNGDEALCINRTSREADGYRWKGDITWDELMDIKRQCGRGEKFAIEVFPEDSNIIDTDNVRHLWIIEKNILDTLPFSWGPKVKKSAYKDSKYSG